MNCADVQSMLWSGIKSEQLTAHLSSCRLCQQEANTIHQLVSKLGSVSIPVPSKSLLPSKAVIRRAVRRNQGIRWRKMTSLAAGTVLILTAGSIIGIERFHQNQTRGKIVPVSPAPLTPNLPGNSPANDQVGYPGYIPLVGIDAKASNSDICKAVQAYLLKILSNRTDVKHIQILDFVIDPGSTTKKTTGRLQLDVELRTGADHPSTDLGAATFTQGNQIRYVLLDKPDGAWSVDTLSSTPTDFANASPTADGLAKTAQVLQGTLVEFNFRTLDDGTGMNRMLEYVKLKVEQNLTTTGGTFKPGDVVRVDINQPVPTQGPGHFELSNGERVVAVVQQADPRYTLGEIVWYCKDLNYFAYESGSKFYNGLGHAVNPRNPLQPLQ